MIARSLVLIIFLAIFVPVAAQTEGLQIGAFIEAKEAQSLVAQVAGAFTVRAQVNGRWFYRVRVPVQNAAERGRLLQRFPTAFAVTVERPQVAARKAAKPRSQEVVAVTLNEVPQPRTTEPVETSPVVPAPPVPSVVAPPAASALRSEPATVLSSYTSEKYSFSYPAGWQGGAVPKSVIDNEYIESGCVFRGTDGFQQAFYLRIPNASALPPQALVEAGLSVLRSSFAFLLEKDSRGVPVAGQRYFSTLAGKIEGVIVEGRAVYVPTSEGVFVVGIFSRNQKTNLTSVIASVKLFGE